MTVQQIISTRKGDYVKCILGGNGFTEGLLYKVVYKYQDMDIEVTDDYENRVYITQDGRRRLRFASKDSNLQSKFIDFLKEINV